jgi:hypothetical protein
MWHHTIHREYTTFQCLIHPYILATCLPHHMPLYLPLPLYLPRKCHMDVTCVTLAVVTHVNSLYAQSPCHVSFHKPSQHIEPYHGYLSMLVVWSYDLYSHLPRGTVWIVWIVQSSFFCLFGKMNRSP